MNRNTDITKPVGYTVGFSILVLGLYLLLGSWIMPWVIIITGAWMISATSDYRPKK